MIMSLSHSFAKSANEWGTRLARVEGPLYSQQPPICRPETARYGFTFCVSGGEVLPL